MPPTGSSAGWPRLTVRDALFEGLDSEGFPEQRRHAVKNLREALALLPQLLTGPSAVLLENDLTDDMES